MRKFYEASRKVTFTLIAAVGLALMAGSMPAFAGEVTDENVADKVASASTSADHLAIATYYRELADSLDAKIKSHQTMRASLASGKPSTSWAPHCNTLIAGYSSAREAAVAMAQEQESLAKSAGK